LVTHELVSIYGMQE